MLVSGDTLWGTIGGGQFEYMAIRNARQLLDGSGGMETMDIPLGPEIGQCCGGRTQLRFRRVTDAIVSALERKRSGEADHLPEVYLFGAGHVGRALAAALAPLPVSVTVVETRERELANLPAETATRLVPMPEALVKDMPAGTAVVILTHDHALDFLIASEALVTHRSRLHRHDRLGHQARHLRKLAGARGRRRQVLDRAADAADRGHRGQGQAPGGHCRHDRR